MAKKPLVGALIGGAVLGLVGFLALWLDDLLRPTFHSPGPFLAVLFGGAGVVVGSVLGASAGTILALRAWPAWSDTPDIVPLFQKARLLGAYAYILLGIGLLVGFIAVVIGANPVGRFLFPAGLAVGGLAAAASFVSLVFATRGWCRTGNSYPWIVIIVLGLVFLGLVGLTWRLNFR